MPAFAINSKALFGAFENLIFEFLLMPAAGSP